MEFLLSNDGIDDDAVTCVGEKSGSELHLVPILSSEIL